MVHQGPVTNLIILPSRRFLSTSTDGQIREWNVLEAIVERTFDASDSRNQSVAGMVLLNAQQLLVTNVTGSTSLVPLDGIGACLLNLVQSEKHSTGIQETVMVSQLKEFDQVQEDEWLKCPTIVYCNALSKRKLFCTGDSKGRVSIWQINK